MSFLDFYSQMRSVMPLVRAKATANREWFAKQTLPNGCVLEPMTANGTGFTIDIRGHVKVFVNCPIDSAMSMEEACTQLSLNLGDRVVYCEAAGFDKCLPYAEDAEALELVVKVAEMDAAGTLIFDD